MKAVRIAFSIAVVAMFATRSRVAVAQHAPTARRCELALSIRRHEARTGTTLEAWARNLTLRPLTLVLASVCPSRPVRFTGLPATVDLFASSDREACSHPRGTTIALAPHASVRLAIGFIGAGTLPPDRFAVSFANPLGQADPPAVCGPSAVTLQGSPAVVRRVPPARVDRPHPPTTRGPVRRHGCPPMVACGLYCPGSFAHDANGCTLCSCDRSEDLRPSRGQSAP